MHIIQFTTFHRFSCRAGIVLATSRHVVSSAMMTTTTHPVATTLLKCEEAQQHDKNTLPHHHTDAPGWGLESGPICYKCRGEGHIITIKEQRVMTSSSPNPNPNNTEKQTIPCKVCHGKGRFPPKRLKPIRTEPRTPRTAPGWEAPGPDPTMNGIQPQPDEELCSLVGKWRILQKGRGGHRWSSDDLLTAWVACHHAGLQALLPPKPTFLDLGCGIGTVLMMCAWKYPMATCTGMEAQQVSAEMATRSITYNGIQHRAQVHVGDFRFLRDELAHMHQTFHLVTGTPPYFGVKWTDDGVAVPTSGGLPTNAQSAPARYEFRGGLEDYFTTAAQFLHPQLGHAVICEGKIDPKQPLKRAMEAARQANLALMKTVFVHGRADKPPLFLVHVLRCGGGSDITAVTPETSTVAIRLRGGKHSEEYKQVIMDMGICPYEDNNDDPTAKEQI